MIKAVIDTNVIVSAYITKNLEAATSKLWEAVLQCKLTPIYNEEILNEYSDVLHREKIERAVNNLALEELEALHYDMITKNYINESF